MWTLLQLCHWLCSLNLYSLCSCARGYIWIHYMSRLESGHIQSDQWIFFNSSTFLHYKHMVRVMTKLTLISLIRLMIKYQDFNLYLYLSLWSRDVTLAPYAGGFVVPQNSRKVHWGQEMFTVWKIQYKKPGTNSTVRKVHYEECQWFTKCTEKILCKLYSTNSTVQKIQHKNHSMYK